MTAYARPAPSPQIAPPADIRGFADGLVRVMGELLTVVEQETALVRGGDVRKAIALEDRKSELSQRYMQSIAQLKASQGFLKQNAPDLLAALRRNHDTFRAMLQINLTVLATAHAVSEGIIRGVNGELQRRNLPQGYTAGGQRAAPGAHQVTPLAVSRSL